MVVSHTFKLPLSLADRLAKSFADLKKTSVDRLDKAHKALKKVTASGADITVRREAEAEVIRARDLDRLVTFPNFVRYLIEFGLERGVEGDTYEPVLKYISNNGMIQGRQAMTEEGREGLKATGMSGLRASQARAAEARKAHG